MKSKLVSKEEILSSLSDYSKDFAGKPLTETLYGISSLNNAEKNSIIWIKGDNLSSVNDTSSEFIICSKTLNPSEELLQSKTFVFVDNPKLVISQLIADCFTENANGQIHPTAFVHPEATIGENVFIGPFVYIGKASIGNNSIIWGHVYIHDNAEIGNSVEIHAGCVIGEIGSGFTKNEKGEYIKFPHIGGVVIEDNVEVGALTYINRGSLTDTLIKKGAKIGNAVCIGHNVEIGENSMVIANSVVAGSSVVGKNCWIAHSCSIRNGITLGDNVFIGMGSVVTSSCPSNTTLFGNPAKDKADHSRWKKIKAELIKESK